MPNSMRILGVAQSVPGFTIGAAGCDCHVHVFGPHERYPLAPDRVYTPGQASVEDLLALQEVLGLGRVVVVHPSPYGTDNSCSLDALRRLGARARGVAVIGPDTGDAGLEEMHRVGMRGARVNLETVGQSDPAACLALLRATAARVAPLGWHVQTFTNLSVIATLHDALLALPTTLVVDHFGRAEAAMGVAQPGFEALLSLVRRGKAYVKLSAPHRISGRAGYADVAPLARALIAANAERMLWGSDWPHVSGESRGDRTQVQPFRAEDDGAGLDRLAEWAGSSAMLRRILVENPARLYGFPPA